MRPTGHILRAVLVAVAVAACGPNIRNTVFQSYEVRLGGPVPTYASPELDPFTKTKRYRITLKYFEDADGKIPYFQNRKKPPLFANFEPVQTVELPAGDQNVPLTPTGNDASLPRISSSQTAVFVQAEILGLDKEKNGTVIARARCPVQRLQVVSSGVESKVLCHAFYGFVGKWNEVRSPAVSRVDFGAVGLPDGKVVIGGGRVADDDVAGQTDVDSIEIYDPTQADPLAPADSPGTWIQLRHSMVARSQVEAVYSALTDTAFFIGGARNVASGTPIPTNAFDVLTVGTQDKKPNRSLLAERTNLAAALIDPTDAKDSVLVVGGRPDRSTNICDPVFATQNGPDLKTDRRSPCLVTLAEKRLLACGGSTAEHGVNNCELIEMDTSQSSTSGETLSPRGDVKCVAAGPAGSESVYLFGGQLESTLSDGGLIEKWDGREIHPIDAVAPSALTRHALATRDNLVYVTGGYVPGTTTPLASGFVFDLTTETVTPIPDMLNPRAGHRLIAQPDGTLMAIGGLANHPLTPVGAEIYVPAE